MKKQIHATDWSKAPILNILFIAAGTFVLGSVLLGMFVHPGFFYFTGFVGLMQLIFGLSGWCPMAVVLQLCGKECHHAKNKQ